MQCLPHDTATDGTEIPTLLDHTSTTSVFPSSASTDMQHQTLTSGMETTPTNQSIAAPPIAMTEEKEGVAVTSHITLSVSIVGGTLIVSALVLLLVCVLYRHARKRRQRRTSLLPKKGEEAAPLLTQQRSKNKQCDDQNGAITNALESPNHSTCSMRKSQVSVSSQNPQIKAQESDSVLERNSCVPHTSLTPITSPAKSTLLSVGMGNPVDSNTAQRIYCSTGTIYRETTAGDSEERFTNSADVQPRVSVDSGCYDLETEFHIPSSHEDDRPTTVTLLQDTKCRGKDVPPLLRPPSTSSCHSQSSKGAGVQSAKDNADIEPLFANWKPSMYHNHVSPAMQRPRTMGGVYSTGHHPQHHRNGSHGSNHRSSQTSSYGIGTSTRTSAKTSRSTSQQAGSITCGSGVTGSTLVYGSEAGGMWSSSGVFATTARQSKTPSQ
jgi:hypothetical protein